ncbi:family 16 glycosylhydrolase [Lacipirellula limnantheis]|uniref:Beta-glucanase n=1 Tax=Lacipirellula limnantheis TaxID=2528024 RepID=A0A517TZD0_9BACT|nr:family 16 glycosylhydrolase [Lacipirellula limnantheis]QDT73726.1 Beta-glucanase precursor [Lacipirellula limnantheis]
MMKAWRKTSTLACGLVWAAAIGESSLRAEVLLRDDFNGSGNVNTAVWRLPFGEEGSFVGRTQFRGDPATDLPQQGLAEPLASDGKVAELYLDTYSPIDPGNQFLGTDLLTKQNFARGGGLTFESRIRLKPTTTGGLVGGFFSYDVQRESPPGTLVRDEIDYELISNQAIGGAPTNDPFTNFWNEGPFTGPGAAGAGQFHNVAGLNLTQFQNYKVEWTPAAIKWYVNNSLVRTQTTNVPDDPMKLHFNLWAPDSSFSDAFNAALTPAATSGANQRYALQVDHVEVNRINTTLSANLLADPSFENQTSPNPNGTGGWTVFNNAFYDGVNLLPQDGEVALKTFGPFHGSTDASGAFQNVPALPGQQFTSSIYAYSPSGDSIFGRANYTTIALQFVNSGGAVIGSVNFSPGTNQKETPIFDGRDPNLIEDEWLKYSVDAIAPTGTAFVRMNLFFIQTQNEGGAVWFDNASLMRLDSAATFASADFNQDGFVNGVDLASWKAAYGTNAGGDADGDGDSDGNDFLLWQRQYTGPNGVAAAGAVPEPGSLALLAFTGAGVACARWSRRAL